MKPVLMLTHNNIELTKRALYSVWHQDIDCGEMIVDNGSTDGTAEWIRENFPRFINFSGNEGVSVGWNAGLTRLFREGAPQVLVVGNDTVLAPWTYRWLLTIAQRFDIPFLTGVAVDQMSQLIEPTTEMMPMEPHPDFSLFLIQEEAWNKIGYFNPKMKHYCSDCDYHLRGHKLGVRMMKVAIPFYHERSSTLRLAPPQEQQELTAQANRDREVFKSIYGCLPGTKEYEELFK